MSDRFQRYQWFVPKSTETTFYLSEGSKMLAHLDRRANGRVLRDCATRGRRNLKGEMIRLRVVMMPSGLGTTVEEFKRFRAALNEYPQQWDS